MGPACLKFAFANKGLEAVVRRAEGDERAFFKSLWSEFDPSGDGEGVEWVIEGEAGNGELALVFEVDA